MDINHSHSKLHSSASIEVSQCTNSFAKVAPSLVTGPKYETTNNHPIEDQSIQLKRTVGLWNGVSIIVGIIVGSGIFVSPQGVLLGAGSAGASLIIWAACGVLALLGALCFAELGTSISASGGDYQYIKLAYGPQLSFLYLWVTFAAILPCSNAISALTFARYVLEPFYDSNCPPPEEAIRFIALALLLILTYINCISIEGSIKVMNTFTLSKVLALMLIISYGLYYIFTGRSQDQVNIKGDSMWSGTETSIPHLTRAFYAGFYTYAGWNSLNFITEEIKKPAKNMPRAIYISIATVTFIYILTNLAYFAVLTKSEIQDSGAIAVLFGKRVMGHGHWLMPVSVALSAMSGLNGGIFAGSRVLVAGARQGQLLSSLDSINIKCLSPVPSIITLGLLSSFYLITTHILKLINYMILVEACFAALAVSTVLVIRKKMPNLERPMRVPTIIPILYLGFSFLLVVLPIWISPVESALGILFMLAGLPVYWLTANWDNKPECYQKLIIRLNMAIQKLTMSLSTTTTTTTTASSSSTTTTTTNTA